MTAPALVLGNDIVAKAWLRSIPRIAALNPASPPVGMTLPAGDPPSWADTGFITVRTVGGTPHADFALRAPVFMVQAVAVKSRATKEPPWNVASRLAQYVFDACYDEALVHVDIPVVEGSRVYPDAHIVEITAPATEPRPITNDPAGFARYTLDFEMRWVA
jgi:hypothetical protein